MTTVGTPLSWCVIRCGTIHDLQDALGVLGNGTELKAVRTEVLHCGEVVYVFFAMKENIPNEVMREYIPSYLPFALRRSIHAIKNFCEPYQPRCGFEVDGRIKVKTFSKHSNTRQLVLGQFFGYIDIERENGVCSSAPFTGLRDWVVKYLCGVFDMHFTVAVPASELATDLKSWMHMAREYGVLFNCVRKGTVKSCDNIEVLMRDVDLTRILHGLEDLVESGLYGFQFLMSDGTAIVRVPFDKQFDRLDNEPRCWWRDFHNDTPNLDPSGTFACRIVGQRHASQMFAGFGMLEIIRTECVEVTEEESCVGKLYQLVLKYLDKTTYAERNYDYDTLEYQYTTSEEESEEEISS